MAHHPMYCSTTNGDDCNHYDSVVGCMYHNYHAVQLQDYTPPSNLQVRVGLPLEYKYGLEKLFYDYGWSELIQVFWCCVIQFIIQ